jgi:hypothetical protein
LEIDRCLDIDNLPGVPPGPSPEQRFQEKPIPARLSSHVVGR